MQGHTAAPIPLLLKEAEELLAVPRETVKGVLQDMVDEKLIVSKNEAASLPALYDDELLVARRLRELAAGALPPGQPDFEGLAADQREALSKAVASGVFIRLAVILKPGSLT